MSHRRPPHHRVILVSTPWPLFRRPSIQLGTLKAYLKQIFPDLGIDAHHVYLYLAHALGYPVYQSISKRTWLAEAVYAALLYPDQIERIEHLFRRQASGQSGLNNLSLKSLTSRIETVSNRYFDSIDWQQYLLAGFSISLCQLTSALYWIRRIKGRFPNLPVVVGGSTFSGNADPALFQVFPEIDLVVNGEGELPLSRIVAHLQSAGTLEDLPQIAGVSSCRTTAEAVRRDRFSQLNSLESLPPPDYEDYFRALSGLTSSRSFLPTLPVELSRGCWWQQRSDGGSHTGCAFCNLNLQWSGYRTKPASQLVHEIDQLTDKHQSLSVALVDNVLPSSVTVQTFTGLAGLNKDLRIFAEIRADVKPDELKTMKQSGLHEIQIGIEALSTRLLRKLRKGTTAIQNLEIMKHCEALAIHNRSNLIVYFPDSDDQDVEETLRTLEFAVVYRPLKVVPFWLGLGSPVFRQPKVFGIKAVFNHPNYNVLFPRKMLRNLPMIMQAYRGNRQQQVKLWRPVIRRVRAWQKGYQNLHGAPWPEPLLSVRDGRRFLLIRQLPLQGEPILHRLVGTSRSIYMFCQYRRALHHIRNQFSHVSEDKLVAFLRMMVDKKLMYAENDRYLSLAVPVVR
jgi:ribosomal peptide maturation radical SAM protein 1